MYIGYLAGNLHYYCFIVYIIGVSESIELVSLYTLDIGLSINIIIIIIIIYIYILNIVSNILLL